MNASDHDQVVENLLIEGLSDAISLGEVHGDFARRGNTETLPIRQVQELTLKTIRDLVHDGLFVLGNPNRGSFNSWDLPLDAAMAKIEDAYVKHFDDWWSWTAMVWMNLTEKGKELALELYHADEPDHTKKPSR
jgi:hypothetical protein